MKQVFDFIIVGAGSAGCVLANRLSADPGNSVLLLEAGGRDHNPMIHIPLGFAYLMGEGKGNWGYKTAAEKNLNQRHVEWPRGKVLGGTSSINGMVYIRGQKEDYEGWVKSGCEGWSYAEVLPYFKSTEQHVEGASDYHGEEGELWVDHAPRYFPVNKLFVKAAVETGMQFNEDFNRESNEGVGYYQVNIKNGMRQSTANAFLKPVLKRPNLTLLTGALLHKVVLENKRAAGVTYQYQDNIFYAECKSEVVLCGGTVNSPQILELSGIGHREFLQQKGIEPLHHLPGVGENLQDHLTVHVIQKLKNLSTYYEETRPVSMVKNILLFLLSRTGLLAHPAALVGAFFKTAEEIERANAQIHFTPAASTINAKGHMVTAPGATATVCLLRPESTGSVHIKSHHPQDLATIRANYLDTENDRQQLIAAIKKTRAIFNASLFDPFREEETVPGNAVNTDEEILAHIREHASSVYHPVGTCKMGTDEMSVVDTRLRVKGIGGLRVADASIMPRIISGNTNATSVMIAERCAEWMLAEKSVERSS